MGSPFAGNRSERAPRARGSHHSTTVRASPGWRRNVFLRRVSRRSDRIAGRPKESRAYQISGKPVLPPGEQRHGRDPRKQSKEVHPAIICSCFLEIQLRLFQILAAVLAAAVRGPDRRLRAQTRRRRGVQVSARHLDRLHIKRIVGLPGDLHPRWKAEASFISTASHVRGGRCSYDTDDSGYVQQREKLYMETLPNGVRHEILKATDGTEASRRPGFDPAKEFPIPTATIDYVVPSDHVFAMGDHRDNSADSRFMNAVGFVPIERSRGPRGNPVLLDRRRTSLSTKIWWWPLEIRWSRLLQRIH